MNRPSAIGKTSMKTVEKIAIILIGLWLVTHICNPLFGILAARIYGREEFAHLTQLNWLLVTSQSIVPALVQIGVAVWLFQQARRDSRSRWTWSLFGLVFGISAAFLYFLMQLVEQMKTR